MSTRFRTPLSSNLFLSRLVFGSLLVLWLGLAPSSEAQQWAQLGGDLDGEAAGDESGRSVSLSGDRMAVGALLNDGNGTSSGHVRVYEWDGVAWMQLGGDLDGEAAEDASGYSVSLLDNRVAIGAVGNDGNGSNSGHVRVYEWDGVAWMQLGGDLDGEAADDLFGYSVSLSGDRMAVGASRNDGNGSNSGHVRVYEWDGVAWMQLGGDLDGEAAGDESGRSVSLSDNRVAIGAIRNDGNGTSSGHVRVYEWDGVAWMQLGGDLDGEAAGDFFGSSVSLSGDRMAIGADNNDGGNGDSSGHVRVYEWDGVSWMQLGGDIDGEAAFDRSGASVSLSGDRVAIGSYRNQGNGDDAGHVRAYEWTGAAWKQLGGDLDGETAFDWSGISVSLFGDRVAIGATRNDANGDESGHVRVYEQINAPLTLTGADGWRTLALPADNLPLGGRGPGFLTNLWTAGYVGADRDQRNRRGQANVLLYDEPTGAFVPPRTETNVGPGEGMWVYALADDDPQTPDIQGGFPKALDATGGTPVTGEHVFPISYTAGAPAPGLNLIGNPYNRTLVWGGLGWDRRDVALTVYAWDPDVDRFRTWNGFVGDILGGRIAPGQGFHVEALSMEAELSVRESATDGDPWGIYGLTSQDGSASSAKASPPGLRFRLSASETAHPSEAFVAFAPEAALGFEEADGRRLAGASGGDDLRLYTLVPEGYDGAGDALSIAMLPERLSGPVEIPLHAEALASGAPETQDVTLAWEAADLPVGWTATLLDRATGQRHALAASGEITLRVSASDALTHTEADRAPKAKRDPLAPPPPPQARPLRVSAHKRSDTRFTLILSPGDGVTPEAAAFAIGEIGPNPASGAAQVSVSLAEAGEMTLTVYDALGRRVAEVRETLASGAHRVPVPIAGLASGTYVVRVTSVDGVASRRMTVVR